MSEDKLPMWEPVYAARRWLFRREQCQLLAMPRAGGLWVRLMVQECGIPCLHSHGTRRFFAPTGENNTDWQLSQSKPTVVLHRRDLEAVRESWVRYKGTTPPTVPQLWGWLKWASRWPDRSLMCAYEDIVSDPNREMEKIMGFLLGTDLATEKWTKRAVEDRRAQS